MWKNIERVRKVKIYSLFDLENRLGGAVKSRRVTKLVIVDLDLMKLCWERFNFDLRK
jgi:hypothetical protein